MQQIVDSLIQDIQLRCTHPFVLPYEDDLLTQIKGLNGVETTLFEEKLYRSPWNIGCARIFRRLHDNGFFSISVYIFRLQDDELEENILTDLLENEPTLFADIVESALLECPATAGLIVIIENFFQNLLEELLTNPKVIRCNYMPRLKKSLKETDFQRICNIHVGVLVRLEHFTLVEAIQRQQDWMEEKGSGISEEILKDSIQNRPESLKLLLRFTSEVDFNGWKTYLKLLDAALASNPVKDMVSELKNFFKTTFQASIKQKSQRLFTVLLLTARQACSSCPAKFGTYSAWYKTTIGEMSYKTTTNDFRLVMRYLSNLTADERSPDIIKTHLNIQISAPPAFCNELVLKFKAISRSHLETLQNKVKPDSIILID